MNDIDHNLLVELRHQLHELAELSGAEVKTSRFLQDFLTSNAKGEAIQVTKTGFVWVLDTQVTGSRVMFRAELDALPISETNDIGYRSIDESVSHKCGHDGHMTILVGTVLRMSKHLPENGIYYFLFQPAEETGQGAAAVLASPKFDFHSDYVFALHNVPGYPIGNVLCRNGSLNAAVTSMIIKLNGKTSHAAEPEKGVNPSMAIASLLSYSDHLQNLNEADGDFRLITPVHINMGEKAYGVSAGYGEMHFTLRAWSNVQLEEAKSLLLAELAATTNLYGLLHEVQWVESFAATDNHKQAVEMIKTTALDIDLDYQELLRPFKWGEDFGLFTEKFKGGFFGLGAGEKTPALHNSDYDFPDDLIEIGVHMFIGLAAKVIDDN